MFALGELRITDEAREAFKRNKQDVIDFIARHATEDWGEEIPDCWKDENIYAIAHGERIVSAYKLKDHTVIWITTDPDRSTTLIAMPWEC